VSYRIEVRAFAPMSLCITEANRCTGNLGGVISHQLSHGKYTRGFHIRRPPRGWGSAVNGMIPVHFGREAQFLTEKRGVQALLEWLRLSCCEEPESGFPSDAHPFIRPRVCSFVWELPLAATRGRRPAPV
jgi:hypothetical protein